MSKLNPTELADFLTAKPNAKIAIFNLAENIGMDLAYFCLYHSLRQLFPNITLDLFRSNVDETNCIGFEKINNYAKHPLNSVQMAVVKQRHSDGADWLTHLQRGERIFPDAFYDIGRHDLILGIGIGGADFWLKQLPEKPLIDAATAQAAVKLLHARAPADGDEKIRSAPPPNSDQKNSEKTSDRAIRGGAATDRSVPGEIADMIKPWERTALEYLQLDNPAYPVQFHPAFVASPLGQNYRDYLRISLRWPDYVRWYYGIERQYDVVRGVIAKIRAAGQPVKLIYNIKDGEIGNNFCRGQSLEHLASIKNLLNQPGDDLVFTYSWTVAPYRGRQTEAQERAKLRKIGIPEEKILKLNLWEDLLQSSTCRTYLSDPGGFAEAISMFRPAEDTFLFPVSWHHAGTYTTMDADNKPIRAKISPVCLRQCYRCTPTVVEADEKGPRRVKFWTVQYGDDIQQIGEDCMGNDHEFFAAAQETVYKRWFERSSPELIDAIVKSYLGE